MDLYENIPFETADDAQAALDALKDLSNDGSKKVSFKDLKELTELEVHDSDAFLYWSTLDGASVEEVKGAFYLRLPTLIQEG